MYQIRIHGRGGQGVVTAAEMLSVAATIIAAVTFPILMIAGIIGGLIANFWLWRKFAEWLDKIFN